MKKTQKEFSDLIDKNLWDAEAAVIAELPIRQLVSGRFWGSLEVQFANGAPVLIKTTQTRKVFNQ